MKAEMRIIAQVRQIIMIEFWEFGATLAYWENFCEQP